MKHTNVEHVILIMKHKNMFMINAKSLMDLNKEQIEKPEFRKLFYGTVKDQLKIPKVFRQNMKLLEEMLK